MPASVTLGDVAHVGDDQVALVEHAVEHACRRSRGSRRAVPSGRRMSTPPPMNVVTHRSPSASTLSPSGMWPSGSCAICSLGRAGSTCDTRPGRTTRPTRCCRPAPPRCRWGRPPGSSSRHSPVPSGFSANTRPGLRSFGQVVRRVGEVQPAVRPEREVVGRLERDAVDLGDDGLDAPVGPRLLDRGDVHHVGPPGTDRAAVLGDVERTVRAEHAGVGAAAAVGVVVDAALARPRDDLAGVGLDHDDPTVGQDVRTLRVTEPTRQGLDGLAHGDLPRSSASQASSLRHGVKRGAAVRRPGRFWNSSTA